MKRDIREFEASITKTLRSIFIYIGGIDLKYIHDASVRTELERLLKESKNEM